MDSFKKFVIIALAVLAVCATISTTIVLSKNQAPEPNAQDVRNKLQVTRILLQNKGEMATAFNLVAGCMSVVTKRQDLMNKFLSYPSLCNETVQPLVLRIFNGQDGVCELGDEHCAFVSGAIRVIALIGAQPRTSSEVDQLTNIIESDFQKRKERQQ